MSQPVRFEVLAPEGEDQRGAKIPSRFTFLVICIVGLFAILSSTMSKNPVLPLFATSLGADERAVGVIAAASTIPGILVSLPAGVLSDVYGRKRVIVGALLIFSTAPFLYLLVETPLQLVGVRFYHGFATAIFGPIILAAIAERYPRQRGERMALFSSATLVGRSVAPFLGSLVLTLATFRMVYLSCAVSAGLALGAALLLPNDRAAANEPRLLPQKSIQLMQGLREVVGNFRILLTSAMEAVQFFVYGAVEVFLVLYAAFVGLSTWQIGVVSGIPIVMAGITKPMMGYLSDKIGRKPLIVTGFMGEAVVVTLYPVFPFFLHLVLVSMAFGLTFATVTASTSAFVTDVCTEGAFGAALGALSTIMDVGQTLGPVIIGLVVWRYGYPISFTVLGGLLFVAGLIFLLAIHEIRKPLAPSRGRVSQE